MLNCILWDNDGTLIDTASLFHDANRDALLSKNILMDETLFTKISQKQGKSIIEYYAEKNELSPNEQQELLSIRQSIYLKMLKDRMNYNQEAFDFIKNSKLNGMKNFMVTGSTRKELILEYSQRSNLLSLFDGIITAEDYIHPKPYPDCFLCVLDKWNISCSEAIVIDDLPRGITAAHRAGLRALRYTPFVARSRYRNFSNLIDLIREYSK